MVSKRKEKFLKKLFKANTLKELLPVYVHAISKNDELFGVLPSSLIEPAIDALENLQKVLKPIEYDKHKEPESKIIPKIETLNSQKFLIYYVNYVQDSNNAFGKIDDSIREKAVFWLEEVTKSVTGTNGFFSKDFNLESYVDKFVQYSGGKRVDELIDIPEGINNADYYYKFSNTIIELKTIQTDYSEKIKKAKKKWQKKAIVTGNMVLGLDNSVPEDLYRILADILRPPFEQRTNKANKQIKETRKLLNTPDANGIVLFVIDGFYALNPYETIKIINDPFNRHFSTIDGFVYVNLRRKVLIPDASSKTKFLIWQPKIKIESSDSLKKFVDWLGTMWLNFPYVLSGKDPVERTISTDITTLRSSKYD